MKWIRTTDRMPKPQKRVLVTVETRSGNLLAYLAAWIPKHTLEVGGYDWHNSDEDEHGNEYAPEGWYELPLVDDEGYYPIDLDVIAWMPLPEPFNR